MSYVWPDAVVEEVSLRFHMTNLRRALGDGLDGARYITTLRGRGYCFVAPVSRHRNIRSSAAADIQRFPQTNLPESLGLMIGRDEEVLQISAKLHASRFITIVGAGGVGKTTVAVAVGHHLIDAFVGAVLLVDLGMLSDPRLVPATVASLLGLSVQSDDATPNLIAHLRNKRILLILDTFEHLIEAVAPLAASIIGAASQVHILATSREALRVDREHTFRLEALACPPADLTLTAEAVRSFPATRLFVERAIAGGARLAVSDAEAPIVANICRKLDGIALAIELAARRVESYGLQQTAALLEQRLTLIWTGSRTAPARQKTLQATIDWSFGLLFEVERAVLRRLAVFVGHFTLDAALEIVTSAMLDRSAVLITIDTLVAKSILATQPMGAAVRYRLLDTTRVYVLEIDIHECEAADLAIRHAAYYRRWLEQARFEWSSLTSGEAGTPHFAAVNNIRAALEWCFGPAGNLDIGIGLAAAAAPAFLALSLLPECSRWAERAIVALDLTDMDGPHELRLQAALGVSLMFMRGGRDAARIALERSLFIAEKRDNAIDQARLLGPLNMFHLRSGDFVSALQCAQRSSAIARTVDDPVGRALAHAILGISLHLRGDLATAQTELEAAIGGGSAVKANTTIYLGFEGRILAKAILARNLWLQGVTERAIHYAHEAVAEASAMGHSLTLAIALGWAISVCLWEGDLDHAEVYTEALLSRAESYSLGPYLWVARGFRGEIDIRRGNAAAGVESLQACLQTLHAAPYELLTTEIGLALVMGLSALARADEALSLLDEMLFRNQTRGDLLYSPELLRVKASTQLQIAGRSSRDTAEVCLRRALELSRDRGARAWELRIANDMATLLVNRGNVGDARDLLRSLLERSNGLNEVDLKVAKELTNEPD